jgi:hypothetical protein
MLEDDSLSPRDVRVRHTIDQSNPLRPSAIRQFDDNHAGSVSDVNMRRRVLSWREEHHDSKSMHAQHCRHGYIILTQGLRLSNDFAHGGSKSRGFP